MEDLLKPCPFCGGDAIVEEKKPEETGMDETCWLPRCVAWCEYAEAKYSSEGGREAAIVGWNTRAPASTKKEKMPRKDSVAYTYTHPLIQECEKDCDPYLDEKVDAWWACRTCNQWLEQRCEDPKCDYCAERPPKPFDDQ